MIYVEDDELIESNNANGMIGITIGLMGCDDGFNVSFSENGNPDCVAMDVDPVEKCFSEMQMEACGKMESAKVLNESEILPSVLQPIKKCPHLIG